MMNEDEIRKAKANFGAIKHQPSENYASEIYTLAIAGIEVCKAVDNLNQMVNDLRSRVEFLETQNGD